MAGHADSKHGLFKIVAGWLHDKLHGKETESLRDYYGAAEDGKRPKPCSTSQTWWRTSH